MTPLKTLIEEMERTANNGEPNWIAWSKITSPENILKLIVRFRKMEEALRFISTCGKGSAPMIAAEARAALEEMGE